MSLVSALEESERSPSNCWNTSNQFNTSDVQEGGKQFDYCHLITQNNTGKVPDALIEEEIAQTEIQTEVCVNDRSGQSMSQEQCEQLYEHQYLKQKQLTVQNQKIVKQEAAVKSPQPPVKMMYSVLQQSGVKQQQQQQQQQLVGQNRPVMHQTQPQVGQNMFVQQCQNRYMSPQQTVLSNNSNSLPSEEELNQQLLRTQHEIEENNKRLAMFGLPPVSAVQSVSELNTQQQSVNKCDYMSSGPTQEKLEQGSKACQMLPGQTQRRQPANFADSNGAFMRNPNQRMPLAIQGQSKTQLLTVSGQKPNILVHTPQHLQRPVSNVQLPKQAMHGVQTTSVSQQSPVQVQTVSTNQNQNQSLIKPSSHLNKINKSNVILEGGGQFEQGQAYVIKDRMGNARTMVWRDGEFHSFDKERQYLIQHSTVDSSQRGRGARGGRFRGRGRGQGQFHVNTPLSGKPTQNIRTPSPVMNNGVRPMCQSAPMPNRPQVNFLRQNLMQQVRPKIQGHPQLNQGPIHTSHGNVNMPTTSMVSTQINPADTGQQRPKLALQNLMPAQQLKPKGEEHCHIEPGEIVEQPEQKSEVPVPDSRDHLTDPPNIPNDPNAYAVCQYCGTTSMDKFKCESCKRMFTSATKYVCPSSAGDANFNPKRRKTETPTIVTNTPTTITTIANFDKNTFYNKKLQEQGNVYVKVINTNHSVAGAGTRQNPRILRTGAPRGRRGGRRGMAVPETVTISSDEEESLDRLTSQMPASPATPASATSRSPSNPGDVECPESPLIPNIPVTLRRGEKTRVKKMEDADGPIAHEKLPTPSRLTLDAKTVRVGTLRGVPVEPILVSENGLSFFIECVTGTHNFYLYPQEIQQCLAKFDSDPVIFFLTTQHCALRTRKRLGMVAQADPSKPMPEHYFDPSGTEMRHQMITIVLEQLSTDTQQEFQKYMDLFKSWGKQGDEAFFMELSKLEADEVFRQSTTVQHAPQGQTSVVPDHGYSQLDEDRQSRSPSPKIGFVGPIIKLLTYPPPPAKGGISITNEDLYCLQEGEFLNDVIIDFYLKYLLQEKLSQVDHDRTHIFSSFFYKRLTQRIRGAAIDDDPNVTLAVKRHARVKTWTRKLDLFNKDFIIVPINEHAHWFLAIICFPGLEKPQENLYIPKAVSSVPMEASCPTPPQPTDDVAEEMETDETEVSTSNLPANSTETSKPDNVPDSSQETEKSDVKSNTEDEEQNPENKSEETVKENGNGTQSKSDEAGQAETQSVETKDQQSAEDNVEKTRTAQVEPTNKQIKMTKPLPLSIRGKQVELSEGVAPSDTVLGIKQPCIIIFDSLSGPSRSRIVTVLKEYLQVEWAVKKGGELNKTSIKGCVPKVPQQNNFSDCGVFMLQYVESFFEDPIQDFSTPMKGLLDWFSGQRIEGKREELRDLIIGLKEKYENNVESKDSNSKVS